MTDHNLMDLTRTDRDIYYADKGATLAYCGHFCPDCGHPTLTLKSLDAPLLCSLCVPASAQAMRDHYPI